MGKYIHFVILAAVFCATCSIPNASSAEDAPSVCPAPPAVQELLAKTFQRQLRVKDVTPLEDLGLCQVHVVFNRRNQILYVDKAGRYLFLGQIVDTTTRQNLTKADLDRLNRFTQEEVKDLDTLVAFSIGPESAPHSLYLVTDPLCPFCKQAETVVEKLAQEGALSTRFLFFPLPSHKGAKESCISIICDRKGPAEFKKGYRSDNQCTEGKEQVEKTVRILQSHGIGGTPTYIFPDGSFHSGVLNRESLLKRLEDLK